MKSLLNRDQHRHRCWESLKQKSFRRCTQGRSKCFALLAVEAFLNEYGYLRFGPEMFEKEFGRMKPIAKKLTKILGEALGAHSTKHRKLRKW